MPSSFAKSRYRVRPGFVFGVRDLTAGAIVELTEQEAAGFLDKLEKVEEGAERGSLWTDAPAPPDSGPPLEGYDDLTAREIVAMAVDWEEWVRALLYEWEAAHKNRVTVLEALEKGIDA